MATAKDIVIKTVDAKTANSIIKKYHYSGKVVNNSQLHFGVFLEDRIEGALQFGPSLDKRKIQSLVSGTQWHEFIELNRMAFSDKLPKNSESRAISIALRLIKKHAPHIKWVISFADGTQCGDGTIYRASGFFLTGIKENNQIIEFPDGFRETRFNLTNSGRKNRELLIKKYKANDTGGASLKPFLDIGARALPGFQLRYIYFIDKNCQKNLTVPILPFSAIDEAGARMYKGIKNASG